ncbi:MAG: GNAT family N-acetyltransferase [Gammaproteobacteria bacterium]|nr:GNAT family N-acetyltransferase [Gammaproteobacteria bacterium]
MLSILSQSKKHLFRFNKSIPPLSKSRIVPSIIPTSQVFKPNFPLNKNTPYLMQKMHSYPIEEAALKNNVKHPTSITDNEKPPSSNRILWQNGDRRIRQMTKDDLRIVLSEWAVREQWNPGESEIEAMFKLDPSGYYILERLDDNGTFIPVTSIAAIKILPLSLASLGIYITDPNERGKGYGTMLWYYVLGTLSCIDRIVLNAVPEQVKNYAKSGFTEMPKATIHRCIVNPSIKWKIDSHNKQGIKVDTTYTLDELVSYQKTGFPAQRKDFLKEWLAMPNTQIRVARDSNNKIVGYGVISRTIVKYDIDNKPIFGYKIAPLFADSVDISNRLCLSLSQAVDNHFSIHIDIPEGELSDHFLKQNISDKKITDVFQMVRMFHNKTPDSDLPVESSNLIAKTSAEFG